MMMIGFFRRYLLMAAQLIAIAIYSGPVIADESQADDSTLAGKSVSTSILPIAMYDSDIGFGFGVKAFVKQTRIRKTYDWILFGSTLGEQWYRFAYSWPDISSRQGTNYKAAIDMSVEYNKYLKSNYFGIGNETHDNDLRFPRESVEGRAALERAFAGNLTGALSLRLMHYSVYGYDIDWPTDMAAVRGVGESQVMAPGIRLKFDTRDDVFSPTRGLRAEIVAERAMKFAGFDWSFWKGRLELAVYRSPWRKMGVLAARLWTQEVSSRVPFQELSKIGDGWTARGYKAGRFLDHAMALASVEYRFPVYSRLGGAIFIDSGRVWPALKKFSLGGWHHNWGLGLRYRLTNFVARMDIGRSVEGTRIFFNFGQVF
jgi:outer membrane protein assembly factor BamA